MASLNEIKKQLKTLRAIHSLKAWQAAFRLLEGAAIEGHIAKAKICELVSAQISTIGLASDKKDFLDRLLEEIEKNKSEKKGKPGIRRPETGAGRLILVDDQAFTNGWVNALNLITGTECLAFISIQEYQLHIKKDQAIFEDVIGVLIDLKLPATEKTGLSLIRFMSNNFPFIPVVGFSASRSVPYIKQAFENGVWDYFVKDPDEEEFKNPVFYYHSFCILVNRLVKYNTQYTVRTWKPITILENKLCQVSYYDINLQKSITEKLKLAYKYLIIDQVNRFAPDFLQINKAEQITNLSGQALETFCNMYLFKKGVISREKGISLRDKIDLMDVFNKAQKSDAQTVRMLRNDGTHQEKVDYRTQRLVAKAKITIADAEWSLNTVIALCDNTFTRLTAKPSKSVSKP
jgi:CheY-like chemotaxis protein